MGFHRAWRAALGALVAALAAPALAAPLVADPEFDEILSLDLADLTVTSVSKRPQRLSDTASAVYVVNKEDILRSGATTIPDALRMVPGLHVAQTDSNRWAIMARGYNTSLVNKMLVLIDGRTVYSPVYSGTYWDDRFVPMTEIERIEVIRGPGASVWGANAMNGTINIITKRAQKKPSNYVATRVGTDTYGADGGHGGKLADNTYYRSYAGYSNYKHTERTNGTNGVDDWDRVTAGMRVDGEYGEGDSFMLTGNAYGGNQEAFNRVRLRDAPFARAYNSVDSSFGGSVNGSIDRQFSADSKGTLRGYIDHYSRLEETFDQHLTTFDIDWQHDLRTSERNNFTWGAGYRLIQSEIDGSFTARLTQENRNFSLYSAFVQNEYALVPDSLFLTLGSKFEVNDFTGFEYQPNARLSWRMDDKQTLWGAVSRAVRTPSIVEDDVNLVLNTAPGPTYTVFFGNGSYRSEEMIAYELGYRVELSPQLQVDSTVFFNDYNYLRTYERGVPYVQGTTTIIPSITANSGYGHVYGFETAATWTLSPRHKLMGSYSYAEMDLETNAGSTYSLNGQDELIPKHMASMRSYWNVTPTVNFDNMLYYVSAIESPVDSYVRYDTRLAWQATPTLEVSMTGYNLLDNSHPEFPTSPQSEIGRSAIARATVRF